MAIAIRGTTPSVVTSSTATVATTLTGARQPTAGDLLVILHFNDYFTLSDMPTPTVGGSTSGVTAVTNGSVDGGSNQGHIKAYTYAVGSTADLTVSVTETGTADEEKALAVYVLSGADTASPISGGSAGAAGTFNTTGVASHVLTGVTPSDANAFLIGHDSSGGGAYAASYTTPGTEAYDFSDGQFFSICGWTEQLSASGATGTRTVTPVASVNFFGLILAIRTGTGGQTVAVGQAVETDTAQPVGHNQTHVTYGESGAIAYSASGGTSVAPAYPAGITAGQMLVMLVGQKPSAANGGTVTTPGGGWALVGSITGAGGYGATLGADTGNTNLFVYTLVAAGTETGTLTVTVGTNGVCWAQIHRFTEMNANAWATALATGSDTSAGNVSATLDSDPGIAGHDMLLAAMCIPTDVTTPAQFTAEAITATGLTVGTVTEISESDSGTGNDIGGWTAYASVTSGTATVAPTVAATAGGTTTNVRGPIVVLRIRATQAGQTIAVGRPVETDTATAVTRSKVRPVGVAGETDTATAVTRSKVTSVGSSSETDTSRSVTARKAVGRALETDVARSVTATAGAAYIGVAQAVETDVAQPVGRVKSVPVGVAGEVHDAATIPFAKVRSVGQAVEVDVAGSLVTSGPQVEPVGTAVEVDVARTVAARKAVGRTVEADTALSVAAVKPVVLGRPVETDTALAVARVKVRAVGPSSETDVARSVGRVKAAAVAQAVETDVARSINHGGGQFVAVGQATETDTARTVAATPGTAREPVSTATESSVAYSVTPRRIRAVGQAAETSSAHSIRPVRSYTLGRPAETGTAASVRPGRVRHLGQPVEVGVARPVGRVKVTSLGVAVGTDVARDVAVRSPGAWLVGRAVEVDVARAVGWWRLATRGRVAVGARERAVTAAAARPPRVTIGERS